MFNLDSVAGARSISGARRPRQQMQYTGYGQDHMAAAAALGVNPGGQLRRPEASVPNTNYPSAPRFVGQRPSSGGVANTRFPMAPRYVGGQQQQGGGEYEQYAQSVGLRGPVGQLGMRPGAQQSSLMSPQARRAFVQNAHDNPNGAYQQFARALAGERQGPYAGVSMNQPPSPMSSRDAFNQQYGQHLGTAMAENRPGMGLLGIEAAAQMGNYRHMPNVTVGGAYGRGPAGVDNSYLNKLLGIDGEGHAVSGGVTDPTTLGALRSRMKAPWMNGQTQMAQAGSPAAALGFDTTGENQAAARLARQAASGGRLNYTLAGNTGNWNFGGGGKGNDEDGNPIPSQGIDINAIVKANPLAAYGLSDESRARLGSDTRQAMAQDLKNRQLAYQARQVENAGALGERQARVTNNAMARNTARQDRMNGVTPEYKLQQQHLQNQNDMLAAQLGLQNRKLGQGDAELAQKDQQFKQQLHAQVVAKMIEAGHDPDEAMQLAGSLGLGGDGGENAKTNPSSRGSRSVSRKDEEKLATMDNPREKRDYMRNVLKLPDAEVTRRLQQDHQRGLWGSLGQHWMGIMGGAMRDAPNAESPEGPLVPAYGGGLPNLFGYASGERLGDDGEIEATNWLAPVEDMFTGKKRRYNPAGIFGNSR